MDKASEAIHALNPVTFRYRQELDPEGMPQFGLIAEEVEKVNPDLVVRDAKGKVYTVRYEAVNAMLLNEFLKEHRKGEEQDRKIQEQGRRVEEQEPTITQLKSTIAQQQKEFRASVAELTARLDEQASQIQKVRAKLEMSKPATQVVLNNPK
jgi:predicted RNase H-like nuclease (RuvC/YqgF family)